MENNKFIESDILIKESISEIISKTVFEIEEEMLVVKIDCKNGSELGSMAKLMPPEFEIEPQKNHLVNKLLELMQSYLKILFTELTPKQIALIKKTIDKELNPNTLEVNVGTKKRGRPKKISN